MFTIYTKQNSIMPANEFTVTGENIKINDFSLPPEIDIECRLNPYNMRLWIIGHTFGAVGCIFASSEQDAFDNAVNYGLMDHCLNEDQSDYENEDLTPLGNAGELFDLSDTWIAEVDFKVDRDITLILALVRASENQTDDLSDYE
jgi:hypothetical protein